MNLQTAIIERDIGMTRVAANNEALNAGWQDLASAFLLRYAMQHKEFFPYDVTAAFEKANLIMPTDDRAWGSVFIKAARRKIVSRGTSIGKHPKRHAVAVLSWNSLIYKEAA